MRTLVVRLDNLGDVLLAGPAVRAAAAGSDHLILACGAAGAPAARMLPGVDEVMVWDAPWVSFDPPPLDQREFNALVDQLAAARIDRALVLTSFHQSPLPAALMLRLARVGFVAADCVDYPGRLLDLRHQRAEGRHEVEAALDLAAAAGFPLPPGDDGRTAVRPAPDTAALTGAKPYLVVHPGASTPSRMWSPRRAATAVGALADAGHRVVVTGSTGERALTAAVASGQATDLGGRTSLAELAGVLRGAEVVVAGNTGPAHLAAAVGTPVVSLFSPVVPSQRWRPWGVPHVLLGRQDAPCAGTRARTCPVPGHPCLDSITDAELLRAVDQLLTVGQGARTNEAGPGETGPGEARPGETGRTSPTARAAPA